MPSFGDVLGEKASPVGQGVSAHLEPALPTWRTHFKLDGHALRRTLPDVPLERGTAGFGCDLPVAPSDHLPRRKGGTGGAGLVDINDVPIAIQDDYAFAKVGQHSLCSALEAAKSARHERDGPG